MHLPVDLAECGPFLLPSPAKVRVERFNIFPVLTRLEKLGLVGVIDCGNPNEPDEECQWMFGESRAKQPG